MYRIKLMILWGLLFSIWLCKSLFANSGTETEINGRAEVSSCAKAVFMQPTENLQPSTLVETSTETTSSCAAEINIALPYDAESYAVGVVAAEMPVYFPEEALKAQAVAARTYACRKYLQSKNADFYSIGQAYLTVDELKARWGTDFDKNYDKICKAVAATADEILIYNNEPILAVFCSASGGKTESSANVWGEDMPYLRSADSSYDAQAPVYRQEKRFSVQEVSSALGEDANSGINITKRSEAGYVLTLKAGKKNFSGDDIRRILGLRSSDFDVKREGDEIVFTSYGYGHGVGMSQYGACYMAENGSSYTDILYHYYSGAELGRIKTNK